MSQSLEQRVVFLEKNIRFYRYSFFAVLMLSFAFGMMSFNNKKTNAPEVIQAKAFQVVDDDGKVLAELNKEDGNGQLSTFTPDGKRLVSLFTTEGGAGGINTFDEDGNVIFKVTNTDEGGGYLAVFNGESTEVAELGVTNQQSGYMRINDKAGGKQAWITYTQDGGGYFSLSNNGKETIRFSTPNAGGRMGLYNAAGTRVGYIGAQESKDGNVTVWNNVGTRTASLPAQ